eukprot:5349403-Prymnesium_polylepis.1
MRDARCFARPNAHPHRLPRVCPQNDGRGRRLRADGEGAAGAAHERRAGKEGHRGTGGSSARAGVCRGRPELLAGRLSVQAEGHR